MLPALEEKRIYKFALQRPSQVWELFAPYKLLLRIASAGGEIQIEIGRFSFQMLLRVKLFPGIGDSGLRLKVGAFCEAAAGTTILVGGEHRNGNLVNHTLGSSQFLRMFADPEELALLEPTSGPATVIEDSVIISDGCLIVDGAHIETGCVIAAGAVVNKRCEAFGVYGGVPAKRLKDRLDSRSQALHRQLQLPAVAAHHVTRSALLASKVQSGDLSIEEYRSQLSFLERTPRIHIATSVNPNSQLQPNGVVGYDLDGEMIVPGPIKDQLDRYFGQAWTNPAEMEWSPDVFRLLNIA
jgi:acetyltransferase-like isoleucine patch superfamily enzyme